MGFRVVEAASSTSVPAATRGDASSQIDASSPQPALSREERALHAEAIGWTKIHLCRQHFEVLYKCSRTTGADCSVQQRAVDECKDKMESSAWRQLQHNGMVQCPREWAVYSECMGTNGELTSDRPNGGCKRLWMDLQLCAAFHVVAHVESQSARRDNKFVPPPYAMQDRTQDRAAAFLFSALFRHRFLGSTLMAGCTRLSSRRRRVATLVRADACPSEGARSFSWRCTSCSTSRCGGRGAGTEQAPNRCSVPS